jgi:hypothetical protein
MSQDSQHPVPALPECSLLEGIVTTLGVDGTLNIAPMGPIVDAKFSVLLLRPFRTSVTFQNLKHSGEGILHVTDDVELLARAAVGRLDVQPKLLPATAIDGVILADACRWYAFLVESLDERENRVSIVARVIDRGTIREFFGFNRAKHAVIEAAILATRIGIVGDDTICDEIERLAILVEKTGGQQERRAFKFLQHYVAEKLAKPNQIAESTTR